MKNNWIETWKLTKKKMDEFLKTWIIDLNFEMKLKIGNSILYYR